MVDHSSGDPSSGSTTDKDYVSRSGQKDHIPVQKDGDPVEDLIDPETANSDKTLGEISCWVDVKFYLLIS